jgi:hypothetical protein
MSVALELSFSLTVAKEFIFPLLFRELASLSVQELRFPSCSLGIYFSLALESMLLI